MNSIKITFQGVKVIEESTVNGTLVQVERVMVVNEFFPGEFTRSYFW